MKKILVALTVLCLLLVPITAVQAQTNGETVRINLNFAPDIVSVKSGDYIVLHHGWGACTHGLIMAYLNAVHTEVRINDVTISVADGKDPYWSPISKASDGYWVSTCIAGNQNTSSVVHWDYPLGTLTSGEYEVYFYYWIDHQLIDGSDQNGDGRLDRWEGVLTERTITIVVE